MVHRVEAQAELENHSVYQRLVDIKALRLFMETHVFAVWDFMSLLKSLQQKVTCVEVPWRPSPYSGALVRLINQIVLEEESDVDQHGLATSHFALYLKAMKEVGANTSLINEFLDCQDTSLIPLPARQFVEGNLKLAKNGHIVEVAASFFFGREKLVPVMFQSIVDVLNKEDIQAPTLLYYLRRHIEIDGNEHGPLAEHFLNVLVADDARLKLMAENAGIDSLLARKKLWDQLEVELQ